MRFSIVTVCLNTENEIGNTIESVLAQSCGDFEYLIKDGCSKDNTLGIARSYEEAFRERGIRLQVVSVPDTGAYDAMNQAAQLAAGEWILFMNAGDWFPEKTVLARIEKSGCLENADIVYGDVIQRNGGLYLYSKAAQPEALTQEMPFCHQSSLVRTSLVKQSPFSSQYRICGDQAFFLKMYREGKRFVYLPFPVSIYNVDGLSADRKQLFQERIQLLMEDDPSDDRRIQLMKKRMSRTLLHQSIRCLFPKQLQNWIRRRSGWTPQPKISQ